MLKLAERMVLGYCNGVGVSTEHMWTMFCGDGATDAKIMTRKNTDDPRTPDGTVISAASSFWIPVPPKRVFDFLIDVRSRSKVRNIQFTIMFNYRIRQNKFNKLYIKSNELYHVVSDKVDYIPIIEILAFENSYCYATCKGL